MKSIDYFEFGLPIINNIKGDTWKAVERCNCGVNVDVSEITIAKMKMRKSARSFFEKQLTEDVFKEKITQILT